MPLAAAIIPIGKICLDAVMEFLKHKREAEGNKNFMEDLKEIRKGVEELKKKIEQEGKEKDDTNSKVEKPPLQGPIYPPMTPSNWYPPNTFMAHPQPPLGCMPPSGFMPIYPPPESKVPYDPPNNFSYSNPPSMLGPVPMPLQPTGVIPPQNPLQEFSRKSFQQKCDTKTQESFPNNRRHFNQQRSNSLQMQHGGSPSKDGPQIGGFSREGFRGGRGWSSNRNFKEDRLNNLNNRRRNFPDAVSDISSGQMKRGGGPQKAGFNRGGFQGGRGRPFCNHFNQDGRKDSNDRRTNFKRISRNPRPNNEGQEEGSDDSEKEKKIAAKKSSVPTQPQILSKSNLGPGNVLMKFVGSEIPSLEDAHDLNIDLYTKVEDVILISRPSSQWPWRGLSNSSI